MINNGRKCQILETIVLKIHSVFKKFAPIMRNSVVIKNSIQHVIQEMCIRVMNIS